MRMLILAAASAVALFTGPALAGDGNWTSSAPSPYPYPSESSRPATPPSAMVPAPADEPDALALSRPVPSAPYGPTGWTETSSPAAGTVTSGPNATAAGSQVGTGTHCPPGLPDCRATGQ